MLMLALGACGSPGVSTAQACADFVDAGHCGSVDLSGAYNCESFEESSCDLGPYFQCLTPHYVCVNNQYDPMAMMGIEMCSNLANCR
jgi:hypothetical protein